MLQARDRASSLSPFFMGRGCLSGGEAERRCVRGKHEAMPLTRLAALATLSP